MPKMRVSKSIKIDKPASDVYHVLSDFHQWRVWSPWLITDPETKMNVSEDGKTYDWEGKRTGVGKMAMRSENGTDSLEMDLNFIKPWKSYADTGFKLTTDGDSTTITWSMVSSLPFFIFFLKKMMEGLIGSDFDRGLKMLKSYCETGAVPSKLSFEQSNYPGCKYIGIKRSSSMESIGDDMSKDFGQLMGFMDNHKELISAEPFSIYHKWNFANGQISYTSGIPVSEVPKELPSGFTSGSIPSVKTQVVKHEGPYDFLGNAWSTAYSMQQAKEIKQNKAVDPFEVYLNNPTEVAPEQLLTAVNFPIK